MACTRKSIVPHCFLSSANTASTEAMSSTSQGMAILRADRFGERLDPPAERLALVGEGELRAVRGERPGDAPGDRMVVGDPHHQAALALHQLRHGVLTRPAA